MVKRFLLITGGLIVMAAMTLFIWQPDSLKKKIVTALASEVAKSTGYTLSVAHVSGNFFTGISLQDVRVLAASDRSAFLEAKGINIGLDWGALLHKAIRVDSIEAKEPTFHLRIDEQKRLVAPWKAQKGNSPEESSPAFRYSIRRLTIEDGTLVVRNHSYSPPQELTVRHIGLSARLSSRRLLLNELTLSLDNGKAEAKGRLTLSSAPEGEFTLSDQQIPIDKILAVVGSTPSPVPLPHTGEWKINMASHTLRTEMKGHLANGPISLDALWASSELTRADLTWVKPGGLSASVHLVNGVGPVHLTVQAGDVHGEIQGQLNVPRRSIQGRGTAKQAVWKDTSIGALDVVFSANARNQSLDVTATDIRFQKTAERSFDISRLQASLKGAAGRWSSTAAATFRNKASTDIEGWIEQENGTWRFTWRKLAVAFPSSGSWAAEHPGTVTWGSDHRIGLHDFSLANGAQSLRIPQAVWGRYSVQLDLVVKEWDPGPWIALFSPDTSLKEGRFNASLRIQGAAAHPAIDGFINGKIAKLSIDTVGLAVHDIELDARGSGRSIDLKRFSGKTKKGEIQITGKGSPSSLDFSLRARELPLKHASGMKATGDVELDLRGSLESPALSGKVFLKDGVYTLTAKENKKTPRAGTVARPSSQNSLWGRLALDIQAQWPRNVWYRDGVTSIETQADLRLQKSKDATALLVAGFIRSVRGTYNYFGRDFTLESGEIQFAGTHDLNPLLNIQATYRADPTVVYLDITGTAREPKLSLRSNPPLPEQDIVSVIVFGRPLNELRSRTGGQTTNQEMMQALGGVLGSYVSKELRQTGISELNVDVLNLQPTSQGSQVTVGRYLTRRLFISYGQTIRGSAQKSLTADYFLTDKWTLQGASNSTEGNYLDFLFRYPLSQAEAAFNAPVLPRSPFRNSLDSSNPQLPGLSR